MDTPVKPAPISGYRSRAINGAVDFAAALRPLAGNNVRVTDGPSGKTIDVDLRAPAARPRPWAVRVVPTPAASNAVAWTLLVYGGVVRLGGDEVAAPTADGADKATGLSYYYAPTKPDLSGFDWLCVGTEGSGDNGAWGLEWHSVPFSGNGDASLWSAIAYVSDDGPPPKILQIEAGVIDLGASVAPLLPFDLAVRPNGHYAVYVGSSDALALDNDEGGIFLDSALDADGYVDLTALAGGAQPDGAWLYVYVAAATGGYPDWHWGVLAEAPQVSGGERYVAKWQIGAISDAGEITQYWHGRIRVADMGLDLRSLDRDMAPDGRGEMQLYQFSAGNVISSDPILEDFVLRLSTGQGTYQIGYASGVDVLSAILDDVQMLIDAALDNLRDPATPDGAAFRDYLDGIYQPLVKTSTTTTGTTSGAFSGIEKDANGKTWQQ